MTRFSCLNDASHKCRKVPFENLDFDFVVDAVKPMIESKRYAVDFEDFFQCRYSDAIRSTTIEALFRSMNCSIG